MQEFNHYGYYIGNSDYNLELDEKRDVQRAIYEVYNVRFYANFKGSFKELDNRNLLFSKISTPPPNTEINQIDESKKSKIIDNYIKRNTGMSFDFGDRLSSTKFVEQWTKKWGDKISQGLVEKYKGEQGIQTVVSGLTEMFATTPLAIAKSVIGTIGEANSSVGYSNMRMLHRNFYDIFQGSDSANQYYKNNNGSTYSPKSSDKFLGSEQKLFLRPIEVLIADIPDFQKNMFTAYIKIKGEKTITGINLNGKKISDTSYNGKAEDAWKGEDYFAVRLKGISIPNKSSNIESLNYQNVVVNKIGSEVKFDRKVNLTFRLDENMYVLRTLARFSSDLSKEMTYKIDKKYKEEDRIKKLNLFSNLHNYRKKFTDDTIDIIIRIDTNDQEKYTRTPANKFLQKYGYPTKIIYCRFIDCRFLGISNNVQFTHSSANPLEVSTTVSFKNIEKIVGNKGTYTYNDMEDVYKEGDKLIDRRDNFYHSRGMIAIDEFCNK